MTMTYSRSADDNLYNYSDTASNNNNSNTANISSLSNSDINHQTNNDTSTKRFPRQRRYTNPEVLVSSSQFKPPPTPLRHSRSQIASRKIQPLQCSNDLNLSELLKHKIDTDGPFWATKFWNRLQDCIYYELVTYARLHVLLAGKKTFRTLTNRSSQEKDPMEISGIVLIDFFAVFLKSEELVNGEITTKVITKTDKKIQNSDNEELTTITTTTITTTTNTRKNKVLDQNNTISKEDCLPFAYQKRRSRSRRSTEPMVKQECDDHHQKKSKQRHTMSSFKNLGGSGKRASVDFDALRKMEGLKREEEEKDNIQEMDQMAKIPVSEKIGSFLRRSPSNNSFHKKEEKDNNNNMTMGKLVRTLSSTKLKKDKISEHVQQQQQQQQHSTNYAIYTNSSADSLLSSLLDESNLTLRSSESMQLVEKIEEEEKGIMGKGSPAMKVSLTSKPIQPKCPETTTNTKKSHNHSRHSSLLPSNNLRFLKEELENSKKDIHETDAQLNSLI
eukprot:Awhi_evm1s7464